MGEVRDMLLKSYLKKGARPPEAKKPDKVNEPELAGVAPPKPIPVEMPKTLGDITTAMMAQRIYNPNLPPAPPSQKTKALTKNMINQGTGPAMSMQGPWGQPPESK